MLTSNKFGHVALITALLSLPSAASAQSAPIVLEGRGSAPLIDGVRSPACQAVVTTVQHPTNPRSTKVTGGYRAGLCEAEASARENLRRLISRMVAQRANGGADVFSDPAAQDALDHFIATARVAQRRIRLDHQRAEVVLQVALHEQFFNGFER